MFREKNEKGQSLVEVALAMPLLIIIMMGILDLGRAYLTYIALSDAAAEGAAYAAIHPSDQAQAIARARPIAAAGWWCWRKTWSAWIWVR